MVRYPQTIKPVSEEQLIWIKIKKILKEKGPQQAIEALKAIRNEQKLRTTPADLIKTQ
jgi:hypothetical protein